MNIKRWPRSQTPHQPQRQTGNQHRWMVLLALLVGLWLGPAVPTAQAADYCRLWQGRQICLERVQRSAKKHWEFRATARVDGIDRPRAAYNCRRRIWVGLDGIRHNFEAHGPGDFICNLLDKDFKSEFVPPDRGDRQPRALHPRSLGGLPGGDRAG
jgi:hypothetical protein